MAGLLAAAVVVVLLREYNWLGAADQAGEAARAGGAAATRDGRPRVLIRLPEFVLETERGDSAGLLDRHG
ncbi:MAG TPA: hypothetical protein VFQ07_10240, partial [Candidatus Polarisedimenticolia bacterium]|nr:hypothetical protein [Candidatus Polarisedimenticolia bacterium]